jgi:hypothetical protein
LHIPIHFGWRTEFRPVAWTFGYCDHCDQRGALRLESVLRVLYYNQVFRVKEECTEVIARCDFCERRVGRPTSGRPISFTAWSPPDGLAVLIEKLGLPSPVAPLPRATDTQLRSLLASVEEVSAKTKVSPVGAVIGGVAGLVLGVTGALLLWSARVAIPPLNEHSLVLILGCAGAAGGTFSGAMVESRVRRNRRAVAMIAAAHAKYRIDLFRLSELSEMYSRSIQKAIRTVSERAGDRIS